MSFAMINLQDNLIALSEENSALHWAATSPEDNTPAAAVAAGHFVQVAYALMKPIRRRAQAICDFLPDVQH